VHYLLASGTLDDLMWRLITRKVAVLGRALDGKPTKMNTEQSQVPTAKTCPACGDPEDACLCVEVEPSGLRAESPRSASDAAADEAADPSATEAPDTATLKSALAAVRPPAYAETDVRFWLSGGAAKRRQSMESSTTASPWNCPACTFLNLAPKCEMCGTARPARVAAPSTEPDAAAGPAVDVDTKPPARTVQFCVSAKTGRIFLYDLESTPLGVAVTQVEAQDEAALREVLPPELHGAVLEVKRFAVAYTRLRAVDQREMGDMIVPSAKATARVSRKRLSMKGPAKSGGTQSVTR
jgi:hypothetical protein